MTPEALAFISKKPKVIGTQEAYRSDLPLLICSTCRKKHWVRAGNLIGEWGDWQLKHPQSRGCYPKLIMPDDFEELARRTEKKRRLRRLAMRYAHNTSTTETYGTALALDKTGLNSLAASQVVGHCTQAITNTPFPSSVNAIDILYQMELDASFNATLGNQTIIFFYASSIDLTHLPSTGAGSGATFKANSSQTTGSTISFVNVGGSQMNAWLGPPYIFPYTVQGADVTTPLMSLAGFNNGHLGLFNWIAVINNTGGAFPAATNSSTAQPVYLTNA